MMPRIQRSFNQRKTRLTSKSYDPTPSGTNVWNQESALATMTRPARHRIDTRKTAAPLLRSPHQHNPKLFSAKNSRGAAHSVSISKIQHIIGLIIVGLFSIFALQSGQPTHITGGSRSLLAQEGAAAAVGPLDLVEGLEHHNNGPRNQPLYEREPCQGCGQSGKDSTTKDGKCERCEGERMSIKYHFDAFGDGMEHVVRDKPYKMYLDKSKRNAPKWKRLDENDPNAAVWQSKWVKFPDNICYFISSLWCLVGKGQKDLEKLFCGSNNHLGYTDLNEDVLAFIVEYLVHHNGIEPARIEKPLRSADMKQICRDPWDAELMERIRQKVRFKMTTASHKLACLPLLNLCCAKTASLIKGKSPEEISTILNRPGDEFGD